ncbi:unnamed protein product [Calypogeia fissa]
MNIFFFKQVAHDRCGYQTIGLDLSWKSEPDHWHPPPAQTPKGGKNICKEMIGKKWVMIIARQIFNTHHVGADNNAALGGIIATKAFGLKIIPNKDSGDSLGLELSVEIGWKNTKIT